MSLEYRKESISLPVPYAFEISHYNEYECIEFIRIYFLQNGCPLCGKCHPVQFYIFVKRQIIIDLDQVIIIKVIRIFCIYNYQQRKKHQKPLQYTITVLPGCLIPYSRIPVEKVFKAFTGYINNKIKTHFEATLILGCNNRHSFRLYYIRIIKRIDTWLSLFQIEESKEGETAISRPVSKKWKTIITGLKDWASPHLTDKWQAYGHTMLCHKKMRLGP